MKRLAVLLIVMTSISCTKSRLIVKNFETSNSLCIDALLVNLASAGCKAVYSSQGKNYVYLRCDDENYQEAGGIMNYEFYLTPTNLYAEAPDTELICSDASVTITTSERD